MSLERAFIVQKSTERKRIDLSAPAYMLVNRDSVPYPVYDADGVQVTTLEPNCSMRVEAGGPWKLSPEQALLDSGRIIPMTIL
jgi:hypothetical protein